MSRLATKIKSIFSFNSDSYHVHKATEEEFLTQPQDQPVISTVLRTAPKPPVGVVGGRNNTNQSIAVKPSDKKQSRQRKVSFLGD